MTEECKLFFQTVGSPVPLLRYRRLLPVIPNNVSGLTEKHRRAAAANHRSAEVCGTWVAWKGKLYTSNWSLGIVVPAWEDGDMAMGGSDPFSGMVPDVAWVLLVQSLRALPYGSCGKS